MIQRCLTIAIAATAGIVAAAATASGSEQTYPSRPITIVVPFPAGGPADVVARIIAERMRLSLGQPIIIENVSGAGGTPGVGRVVRAAPDGYTLSLGDQTSHVSSSAIFPVHYDVLKDLEPVALLPSEPEMLVGKNSIPASNLKELIAWLKANPDRALAALPGAFGSGGHLCSLDFQKMTGTRFGFVPYRGGAPALQDFVAGHVDLMFAAASAVLPYVRSGQIRAYGISSKSRWAAAPEIPMLAESGVPLYFSLWRGLWAPRGTPKDVVAKLNAAVAEALADSEVAKRFAALGLELPPPEERAPEALRTYHREQAEKWWPIIKAADIRPQ